MLMRSRQRGTTLTEMVIGITLGLIILAGAVGMLSAEIRGNTDLLRTTRLNNEMRSAMDMITHDLRRAGYWGAAPNGVWWTGLGALVANPFASVDTGTPGQATYAYDANGNGALDDGERFRVQLNTAVGAAEFVSLSAAGATISTSALTDFGLTNFTGLAFAAVDRIATTTCLKGGPGPVLPTPPLIHIRQITVTMTAQLRADPAVTRTLAESVRVRNDWIEGSCPS